MSKCKYQVSWVGRCNAPADDSGLCSKHLGIKCCVCGKQAVDECSHTGQFVCGAPLCADCQGFTDQTKPSGNWGFMNHGHKRKEAAK